MYHNEIMMINPCVVEETRMKGIQVILSEIVLKDYIFRLTFNALTTMPSTARKVLDP